MKEPYCNAILDFSSGNAFDVTPNIPIPTSISFGRQHNGKFQKSMITGCFTYSELLNIVFLIKRGYTIHEINSYIKEK